MNKLALITGASSGIGAGTAILFARNGYDIAFTYKENVKGADETKKSIETLGREVLSIQANLTVDEDAQKVVEETISKFGKVDVLVNNAGRYLDGDEWNGELNIWEESIKQNLLSVMSISKYAIQEMQKVKSGVVVNIASRYSVSGNYEELTYSASKSGIVNLTQGQAKLMAPWGRSNSVSPGVTRTGYWLRAPKEELESNMSKIPLGEMLEPEDVAETVYFLASDKARMITGQNLIVDGGYTLK